MASNAFLNTFDVIHTCTKCKKEKTIPMFYEKKEFYYYEDDPTNCECGGLLLWCLG